jgi:hypothetical protein
MVGESEEIRLMAPIDAVEAASANRDLSLALPKSTLSRLLQCTIDVRSGS